MYSSDRRSPHLKVPSRSCQRGRRELQGHLCWTWVKRKGLTKFPGWTNRPYRPMASSARKAQGLKDDEEVDKTLSETLNDESSTFKQFTVKQVFPREPYRLKMHKDVLYQTKLPNIDRFGEWKLPANSQMSQKMVMDAEELTRRSTIYASLTDSMVAWVISELSPKDERTKLLKEKLAVIQKAVILCQLSSGLAAAFNLQLLRRDVLLKNFGFQPQVLSGVCTAPFEGSHVIGPEPRYFNYVCVTYQTRGQDVRIFSHFPEDD